MPSPDPYKNPEYIKNRILCLAAYEHTCWRCGNPATTADHIIPVSKGGHHNLENLRAACVKCNTSRGNKIEERYPWLNPELGALMASAI